jgi:Na+-transporting NADH:ubiquinone oxidoreductase subunit NqrD
MKFTKILFCVLNFITDLLDKFTPHAARLVIGLAVVSLVLCVNRKFLKVRRVGIADVR